MTVSTTSRGRDGTNLTRENTYNVNVATGKRTTTARLTTYSEKYRP